MYNYSSIFNDAFATSSSCNNLLYDFFNVKKNYPNYSIKEDLDNEVQLIIEMPGVKREDIEIEELTDKYFNVKWTRDSKKYSQDFKCHEEYDLSTIKAKLEDGILTITILKSINKKVKTKIKID